MNGFDLIARCLKAEGVSWMACFPANPLIEAAAKIGIRPIAIRVMVVKEFAFFLLFFCNIKFL